VAHLSDGTFGRVLKVRSLLDHKIYAMKVKLKKTLIKKLNFFFFYNNEQVIKSVAKYVESAKVKI